jgi:hypothetical protein
MIWVRSETELADGAAMLEEIGYQLLCKHSLIVNLSFTYSRGLCSSESQTDAFTDFLHSRFAPRLLFRLS